MRPWPLCYVSDGDQEGGGLEGRTLRRCGTFARRRMLCGLP